MYRNQSHSFIEFKFSMYFASLNPPLYLGLVLNHKNMNGILLIEFKTSETTHESYTEICIYPDIV